MKKQIEYCWDEKYNYSDLETNIEDWLVPSRSEEHGCPMKKISAFASGAVNAFEDFFIMHKKQLSGQLFGDRDAFPSKTLRVCSGVNDLFSRSLVYLAPSDIAITYTSDYKIMSSISEPEFGFDIEKHDLQQTDYSDGSGNLLDGRIALKFTPPFKIKSPCDFLFLNPTWHTDYTPWRVMSGVVRSGVISPSLFLELPILEDVNHLEIKKGEPLAYIYFTCDVDTKLKKSNLKTVPRKSFIRGFS